VEEGGVRCTIECCGLPALKPSPAHIKIWADSAGAHKTAAAIEQAQSILAILAESTEPLSCKELNYREQVKIERPRLQKLLRTVIAALQAAPD
jgi:hypothetical protein